MNHSLLITSCLLFCIACGTKPPPQVISPVTEDSGLKTQAQTETEAKPQQPKTIPVENSTPREDKAEQNNKGLLESQESMVLSAEEKVALEESYQLMNEAKKKLQADNLEEGQQILNRVAARTPNIPEVHYN